MSNSPTVPIIGPDGKAWDIPYEKMHDALSQGGKMGVYMKDPQGQQWVIPADRTQDAVKAGGTIVPYNLDQSHQNPGFWSSLGSDLKAMLPNVKANPDFGNQPLPGRVAASVEINERQKQESAQEDAARKAAGYSAPYRALAPVAEGLGVNVGGMEQSAAEGDVGGVAGHAAAVPTVMAATEGVGRGITAGAKAAAPFVEPVAGAIRKTADVATFERVSKIWNAWKDLPAELRAKSAVAPTYPGAPLPETPPAEFFQARGLAQGGAKPYVDPAAGLEQVPQGSPQPGEIRTAQSSPEAGPLPKPVENAPQTLSGESALRQVLTAQGNKNLLTIAKSRGISVSREAQLKPGVADRMIIDKIVDDFAPEELDEIGAQYLENSRFRHSFGDIGPEAWNTLSLQTYFPDLKIPAATLKRTQAAIGNQ